VLIALPLHPSTAFFLFSLLLSQMVLYFLYLPITFYLLYAFLTNDAYFFSGHSTIHFLAVVYAGLYWSGQITYMHSFWHAFSVTKIPEASGLFWFVNSLLLVGSLWVGLYTWFRVKSNMIMTEKVQSVSDPLVSDKRQ
jgi:hypothetical protein